MFEKYFYNKVVTLKNLKLFNKYKENLKKTQAYFTLILDFEIAELCLLNFFPHKFSW